MSKRANSTYFYVFSVLISLRNRRRVPQVRPVHAEHPVPAPGPHLRLLHHRHGGRLQPEPPPLLRLRRHQRSTRGRHLRHPLLLQRSGELEKELPIFALINYGPTCNLQVFELLLPLVARSVEDTGCTAILAALEFGLRQYLIFPFNP